MNLPHNIILGNIYVVLLIIISTDIFRILQLTGHEIIGLASSPFSLLPHISYKAVRKLRTIFTAVCSGTESLTTRSAGGEL